METENEKISDQYADDAESGKDLSKEIPRIVKLLSDESEHVRQNVIFALGTAAKNGQDISEAIPGLIELLSEKSWEIKSNVLFALNSANAQGADITPALPALSERLLDENDQVRRNTMILLASAEGMDISPAIDPLFEKLFGKDERLKAASTIVQALETGLDLSDKVPELAKSLVDKDDLVGREVTWALYDVVGFHGKSIKEAVPGLTKSLEHDDLVIRGNAAIALTVQYLEDKKEDEVKKLLSFENVHVMAGAAWGWVHHCLKHQNREKLEELLSSVKAGIGARDVAIKQGVSSLLGYIEQNGGDTSFVTSIIEELSSQQEKSHLLGFLMK